MPKTLQENMPKEFEIKICDRHKKLLPDVSDPQTQIMEIKACKNCQSLANPEDNQLEIDGLLLAQNKEQYQGKTVFHLPFTGGTIVKMMTLADVKALLDKQAEKQGDEMVKRVERIKLDMDVIICDCGEPYSDSDAADLVNELFEDLTNNRREEKEEYNVFEEGETIEPMLKAMSKIRPTKEDLTNNKDE